MTPALDELELTLFGPGYGESAVLHVGGGDWVIVDSCLDPTSKEPAALAYLSDLGVDVAAAVRLVCISHWHDDHVRGISKVVDVAQSATCVCSAALRGDEARAAFARGKLLEERGDRSGVRELLTVLQTLQARRTGSVRPASAGFTYAIAGTRIFQRTATESADDLEIFALSPSSGTFHSSLHELIPRKGEPRLCEVAQPSNDTSMALHFRLGARSILLGSDLENVTDTGRGWRAVVADASRPTHRSGVYKVAHHGSRTGELAEIWTQLVEPEPLCMLTPFVRGRTILPSSDDVSRLAERAGASGAWITTDPRAGKQARYENAVERTVREMGVVLRERPARNGFLRMRWRSQREIKPFGGARRLGGAW